jgi:YVTN family beta-propeller protein
LDSFQLGSGVPSTRLGIAFAGGNDMYMTGHDNTLYHIDMATGNGSVYRTMPWSSAQGLAWSVFDNAAYPGDWYANECAWAIPSQTGAWNTWSSIPQASGLAASFSATTQPQWLFVCNEWDPSPTSKAKIYRYGLVNGVPNATPDFIWDLPNSMTHKYTGDCAFDGQYLYILDQSDGIKPNMVWVLDVTIHPWFETSIEVPFRPSAMVWNETDNKIYVGGGGDSLTIIDGATNNIITNIRVNPTLGNPPFPDNGYERGLVWNPINNKVYAAGQDSVTIIDGTTNNIITTVPRGIPKEIGAMVWNSINNKVYVANDSSDNVTVIDGVTNNVIATVPVGDFPGWAVYNSTNNKVYVGNHYESSVSVIDGATNNVIATIPTGERPCAGVWNSTNNKFYSLNGIGGFDITVIDGATNNVITTIFGGNVCSDGVWNSTNNKLYALNYYSSGVRIIDCTSDKFIYTTTVGSSPYAAVWNSRKNRVFVANSHSDNVSVIDGATNLVTHTIPVGDYPWRIIYNSTNDRIYVANLLDSTVSVIKDQGSTGIPEINTYPSELVFNYNLAKDYGDFQIRTVTRKIDPVIDPDLTQKMAGYSEEELIPIIINMAEHVDLDYLLLHTKNLSKKERRGLVISQLKSVAQTTQTQLLKYLQDMEKRGKVEKIIPLWITNSIGVKSTKRAIEQISQIQGIGAICFDPPLELIDNQKNQGYPALPDRAVVWNVQKINAPGVWQDGYTGKGIVIGHLDSGVNYNHTDLADHMWDGSILGFLHHGYDFSNDDNDPIDDDGHGTHVAGTVAGDGTSGTQTGVAPDARIMALKIHPGTGATFRQGVQFAINYGADILTCSVGWEYYNMFSGNWARVLGQGVYAAGVVWCCAAGNGGYGNGTHKFVPEDIIVPACVPAPWYAPNGGNNSVMAVGATDASDVIADFSSWGPTYWDNSIYDDYPYPPGLLKPDVSAPGVNITSLDYASNSGYVSGWDGTSMAAPHLAGTIALLLEKNPYLTPRQIDSIIEVTSIELGPAGRDSLYGAGRIDAYEASLAVTASTSRNKTFYVENESGATGGLSIGGITWSASWIKKVEPTLCGIPVSQSWPIKVYVDSAGIPAPGTYWDTLWIHSNDPDENPYPEPVCLITTIIGIEETEKTTQLPVANALSYTWPNPFRSSTQISYAIANESKVSLVVYNVLGQQIKTLVNKKLSSGCYETMWYSKDDRGRRVPAGVYFVQLEADDYEKVEKMVLLH